MFSNHRKAQKIRLQCSATTSIPERRKAFLPGSTNCNTPVHPEHVHAPFTLTPDRTNIQWEEHATKMLPNLLNITLRARLYPMHWGHISRSSSSLSQSSLPSSSSSSSCGCKQHLVFHVEVYQTFCQCDSAYLSRTCCLFHAMQCSPTETPGLPGPQHAPLEIVQVALLSVLVNG